MSWYLIFFCISALFLLVPLIPAIIEWRTKSDANPINIPATYYNDATYFAQGFRTFLTKNLPVFMRGEEQDEETINTRFENGTPVQIVGKPGIKLNDVEIGTRETSKVLVSTHPLVFADDMLFESEIYSQQEIITGRDNYFRAILAEGKISFGSGNKVLRWAHSERHVTAGERCEFFGRVTAAEEIYFSKHTKVQRVYAPVIYFGLETKSKVHPKTHAFSEFSKIEDYVKLIDISGQRYLCEEIILPQNFYFKGDMVSRGKIVIGEGSYVIGNLKSNQEMEIKDNTHIEGSVVSTNKITIGKNCTIKGPVISEEEIIVSGGTIIGSPKIPATLSAKRMEIALGVVVYGTIWGLEYAMIGRTA